MPSAAGLLILHHHALVAHALGRFLAGQPGFTVVGVTTDGAAALDIAKTETPELAIVDVDCLVSEGSRLDERLKVYGVTTLVLACEDDPRIDDYGLARDEVLSCREPVAAVLAVPERLERERGVSATSAKPFNRAGPVIDVTPTERAVLQLVAEGWTSKEISEQIGLSPRTVDNHRSRLMKKLSVRSGAALVWVAVRTKILEP